MTDWTGLFPAITTQFSAGGGLDIGATQQAVDALIGDGVQGIICLGTVGENCSLAAKEKRRVLEALVETVAGRVPLLSGAAEYSATLAADYARDAERIGVDGLMLLPAMVHKASQREAEYHFRTVARATGLPIMIYNNPVSYGVDLAVSTLERLADVPNFVAIKESSEDTRRITDIANALGERYTLFAGVDDLALESLMLGAKGWVAGLANAFPAESLALYRLASAGRYDEARTLYRWFMPLLHLDTRPTLVQCIKLAAAIMGRGTATVRAPRLPLEEAERAEVERLVERARKTRPRLPADL